MAVRQTQTQTTTFRDPIAPPRPRSKAPQFKAEAVRDGAFEPVSLSDYAGKYVVLFFYPFDFTFVCPTEIIAFSEAAAKFRALDCEVIAASCDSKYTHLAWINTDRARGGLGPMQIPLVADPSHELARKYGVLLDDPADPDAGGSLRGLFIIDGKQVVRHVTMNDLPVGRNVDEVLRLVEAFKYTDAHGEVCPANWKPGDRTVVDDPDRAQDYFAAVNPAGKVAAAEEAKRDSGSGGGGGAGEPAGVLYCSSSAEVDAAVSAAGALPVVVMYSATWCGKCKALYPSFRGYADEHGDAARFVKVDVDVAEDVADDAAVRSVPTVVVHKAGKELARYTGANASEVLKVVSSAL